jgi:hypothetical protein
MKKIAIVAALILVTGLTALSVSGKENKTEALTVKVEKADAVNNPTVNSQNARLATAD